MKSSPEPSPQKVSVPAECVLVEADLACEARNVRVALGLRNEPANVKILVNVLDFAPDVVDRVAAIDTAFLIGDKEDARTVSVVTGRRDAASGVRDINEVGEA